MKEKELKTSTGQRVAIGIIAFIMLGSIIASYAAIIAGNSRSSSSSGETKKLSDERIAYYRDAYLEKIEAFEKVSANDYKAFSLYVSEIKAYNETSANEGVAKRDLLAGNGRVIGEKDGDYLAYYVGWCADETIFDSSLDDNDKPTAFTKAIDTSVGMIEGWYQGMQGARLGGVREITVPGELAYGDKSQICGGYNKPLRFLVMAVPAEEPLKTAASEVDMAFMKLQYANNGIDYEKEMVTQNQSGSSDGTEGGK